MNRFALLIGNDKYENESFLPPLDAAERDILAVSEVLREARFDVTSLANCNRAEMDHALIDFAEKLRDGDAGIFWFAGHGVQFDNHNFLLPIDIKNQLEPRYLAGDAIDLDRILAILGRTGANPLLLFVDACRTDISKNFRTYHRGIGPATGLAMLHTPPRGFMVIFSAGTGEVALDKLGPDDKNPHSLFTREVLPFLRKSGISIRDSVYLARDAIWQKARSVGHNQMPAIYDQAPGDFYLVPPSESSISQQPIVEIAPPSDAMVDDRVGGQKLFVQDALGYISVVISHDPAGMADATKCRAILEKAGFSVFCHSNSGDQYRANISNRIRDCHFFLPLISEDSFGTEGVQRDLGLAIELKQRRDGYRPVIIPIFSSKYLLPDTASWPTNFPTRNFETGEERQVFELDVPALGDHGRLTPDSAEALIALMRPSLLVSRYNFDDEETFFDTGVFDLYEQLFPLEHERDSPADIMRWVLRADLGQTTLVKVGPPEVTQYKLDSRYFIMTLAGRAIGLGFFTYDYFTDLIFGNYIAVEQSWRGTNLAKSFLNKVKGVMGELFPKYKGIVFEVEKLDRQKLIDTIQYLEQQKPTERKFRTEEDRTEIRKFLRIFLYQYMGCDFFKERRAREPLAFTSPCLAPDSDDWSGQEDDYWIMWQARPGIEQDLDKTLWRNAVQCIYIEVLAKSLAEAYKEYAGEYWEYANRTVTKSLARADDVTLGRYLDRHDDDLMKRWVRLGMHDVSI